MNDTPTDSIHAASTATDQDASDDGTTTAKSNDLPDPSREFLADAIAGLQGQPRTLPCKYLYDERGSELFEQICATDEYYVTRADLALHESCLDAIAAQVGPDAHIIEFGSGAGIKIRRLLETCQRVRAYSPIEISGEALAISVARLADGFPHLEILPLEADYTQPLPDGVFRLDPPARRRVVYFPGSTISNFERGEARDFLGRMARIAGAGGGVLIGVDLVKDVDRLRAAYDDDAGVTAAFNLNLLERLRSELGAGIELDAFSHEARWDAERQRIEMHLVAERPTVIVLADRRFEFQAGDSIHTENSHKYTIEGFRELARSAGLVPVETWLDPDGLFSMHYLEPAPVG
ncbi:L-histidine N(alpha)-methyltransferase [Wenzhouxiangella sp. XN79A]|uniref:L-histidine N(alpha)-methyltransferase n=1 Tax=Wenzhouxiangella sp. XN79A TaxID=2724193 RepID=UPI00144A86C8|nr:L-histidine N(alpha)-methyltransferase [Wenzhouxiangella sp. XN79A]NKI35793.1 L-histidine N(alpha)-methyltransferase [Wenzhouxiangella sp. XN79A]